VTGILLKEGRREGRVDRMQGYGGWEKKEREGRRGREGKVRASSLTDKKHFCLTLARTAFHSCPHLLSTA